MKSLIFVNNYRNILKNALVRRYYRLYSTEKSKEKSNTDKIRNIGILAHIDAGKTTTTERMLFYSGTIRSMGEVHHGNTVTDYMEQERQRGITITSAAVSFPWQGYQINLIDTPGHIDFTMEVEQSLSVLDGAVVVLDGSAGVEAQTLTVWRQANGHRVPRLVYVNKLDRADADALACARSVQTALHTQPLLLQLPLRQDNRLIGVIDLVTLEEIIWTQGRGWNFIRRKLSENTDGSTWEYALNNHRILIDTLSSLDDKLAETIIQQESLDNIETKQIQDAIRRCTLDMKAYPILCGSSYRNIGVQTLIDAVVSYLPSPVDRIGVYDCFAADLCARAFKVQHDDQRGVLTFLRLYSGEITKGQKIYNLAREKTEQTGSLYVALADDYRPVETVSDGNIAVVGALKAPGFPSRCSSAPSSLPGRGCKARWRPRLTSSPGRTPASECTPTKTLGSWCWRVWSYELDKSNIYLKYTTFSHSSGMGELHLEVIKERIIREYKIEVELGVPQISYREMLVGSARHTFEVDHKIGSARQMVKVELSAKTVKAVTQDKILKYLKC